MKRLSAKLLQEPLVHFLLLGAAIFAVYNLGSKRSVPAPGEIVVTQAKLENLVTGFIRTWQRPPSEEEMRGLIRDYIREEVAYREALAMGLDRDDTIIRRRLQQKLEFLNEDLAARGEATDSDLERYLRFHPQKFKTETTITFRQLYLNPQAHGPAFSHVAALTWAALEQAAAVLARVPSAILVSCRRILTKFLSLKSRRCLGNSLGRGY